MIRKGLLEKPAEEASSWAYLLKLIKEHIFLTLCSLAIALSVSFPSGILMSRHPRLARAVFPCINTLQTIPGLALLGLLIPLVGIGTAPALIALSVYGLLPLISNIYTGIKEIDPLFIEVSRGTGLTKFQILRKIEIPLAMPVILAGVRTAAVIITGTATLAALVGGGALGDPIFRGMATVNTRLILTGAVPSALLAILIDRLLCYGERYLVSKGLRIKHENKNA